MAIRLLQDFILPALQDERYDNKLRWDENREDTFLVWWVHRRKQNFQQDDFAVFTDWDAIKGRCSSGNVNYLTISKQRFRSALYKTPCVTELQSEFREDGRYRCYKLLDQKRTKKNKRNWKSILQQNIYAGKEKICPVITEVQKSPLPSTSLQEFPYYSVISEPQPIMSNNICDSSLSYNYFADFQWECLLPELELPSKYLFDSGNHGF